MNAVLKKTITGKKKKKMNAAHCCLPSHSLRNESPHLPLSKKTKTRIRSNIYIYIYIYEKQVQVRKQTGAIYSSVPTKEFEALIGSAIKTGGAC
jgi:hypothetical protein